MAKQKQDKEDILREATALVNRVELKLGGEGEPDDSVFVGFRRDGAVSFFFGAEPVYQFNTQHAFRRGYYQNTMLKAEQGKLVQLTRSREGEQLVLLRREFDNQQTPGGRPASRPASHLIIIKFLKAIRPASQPART